MVNPSSKKEELVRLPPAAAGLRWSPTGVRRRSWSGLHLLQQLQDAMLGRASQQGMTAACKRLQTACHKPLSSEDR